MEKELKIMYVKIFYKTKMQKIVQQDIKFMDYNELTG